MVFDFSRIFRSKGIKIFYRVCLCLLSLTMFLACEQKVSVQKLFEDSREMELREVYKRFREKLSDSNSYVWDSAAHSYTLRNDVLNEELKSLQSFHQLNHVPILNGEGNKKNYDAWFAQYKEILNKNEEIPDILEESNVTVCDFCKLSFKNKTDLGWTSYNTELFYKFDKFLTDVSKSKREALNLEWKAKEAERKKKEAEEAARQAKLKWMSNCDVAMSELLSGKTMKVNDFLTGFPKKVKVTKRYDGNNLIVHIGVYEQGTEVVFMDTVFVCTKNGNRGTCYVSDVNMVLGVGQKRARCDGTSIEDLAECLGMFCGGINIFRRS